ncbi:hypothetical protein ALQ08_200300 [Pseudomonas syringae pv. delphinii]|uniref:Uncharacterized protein n=1 Tax=Pseudomonas syringae pv. delphinii TaxID=192088 RepID=A0A3M4JWL5_9PSED|nr:hypothetical protein ALQ08_200300 [Pseudomonas syringae pv. delphinii]
MRRVKPELGGVKGESPPLNHQLCHRQGQEGFCRCLISLKKRNVPLLEHC